MGENLGASSVLYFSAETMKVSVIIPSYNSENTISDCLNSLRNQTYLEPFEIILADSSTDRTPEIVRENFPEVMLIHFNTKTDPGSARNAAIKKSSGDVLLFLDSDCAAHPEWMERMVKRHLEFPEAPGVGGAVINGKSSDNMIGWAGYLAEFREFIPQQSPGFVWHLPTMNISYKRWVFEQNGFFDPHFYPQEDLVFNYRLTGGKPELFFDPEILVYHSHRTDFPSFLRHQRAIGKITAQVLKVLPLPGSKIVQHRLVFLLLGPALPGVKILRTCWEFLKRNPRILITRFPAVILFMIGMIPWFLGFLSGVFASPIEPEKPLV